jgi:hypothetical protein
MTTVTKTKTATKRKAKALAIADASLALNRLALDRAEALSRIEALLAKGSATFDELEAIVPLLEGHARGLLEDVIGAKSCGSQAWGEMLAYLPRELRKPSVQYQPGLGRPVPYPHLA